MGSITPASPSRSLGNQLAANQGQRWAGDTPLVPWKYTGAPFDFAADASGTGNAVVPTLGTVPADAVAVEMWVNGNAADDYIFVATVAGQLGSTGVFATNITANQAAVRWAANGGHIIIPFTVAGTAPTLRVATGKASARIQGRFISQASGFPYLLGSATNTLLTGANGVQQLPFNDSSRFPAGHCGAIIQILGTGPARIYTDGTSPTATTGDMIVPGTYLLDTDLHGVSLSALKFYLPTGTNVFAHSIKRAA